MNWNEPYHILANYQLPAPLEVRFLGNHGGLSGARLWRVATALGDWCLRAWPDMTAQRLEYLHGMMAQARRAGLTIVPAVRPMRSGATFIDDQGQCWDLTQWLPGQADYWRNPTPARLVDACRCLADLHQVWRPHHTMVKPCPGWVRRQAKAQEWLRLVDQGWRPVLGALDPIAPAAQHAWSLLAGLRPWLQSELLDSAPPLVPVQPCLCDPWHDHVLFTGDRVTGLIDYGSVKEDHVAVDLARLLGSLIEDDEAGWGLGLAAYNQRRALTEADIDLARRLDRTGVVLAAATWLRWLLLENRQFENRLLIAERLRKLTRRMEKWLTINCPSRARQEAKR